MQLVSPRIHVGAQRWRLPGTTIVKEFRAGGSVRPLGWHPEKSTEESTGQGGA